MNKGPQRGAYKHKADNFGATMRRLLSYLRPYMPQLIISSILAVLAAVLTVLTPYFSGLVINYFLELETGIQPVIEVLPIFVTSDLIILIGLVVSTALLAAFINYFQAYLLIGMTQKLTYKMRIDLADKINELPLKFFDKYQFGDILSRVTNDVDVINQTLTQSLSEVFRAITLVIAIVIIMFILSWQLALIVTAGVIISLFVAGKFVKISQKYFRLAAEHNGEMSGHVEEIYHGHQVVKVFNHQKKARLKFNEVNDDIYASSWKSQFISSIMFPVQFFFANLSYIGIVIVGAFMALYGSFRPGFILTFIQYTRQVNQPIQTLGQMANILQQTAASAERIFFILDAESEPSEAHKQQQLTSIKGHVKFENIHFSYTKDKEVIRGFNAEVKAGQTVAIVGPTGAGKTTIVNLLMRFYEVDSGRILIDGVDIKDMKRDEVRSYFGMVLQDTWIFDGTVMENISYGTPQATIAQIEDAADQAQTHHFIKSLSGSYKFHLGEDGTNISQGQRQLITISRAMLANKPMLILDEATSSVDTRTEILIQKAMDALMEGRTSFVIAHRLSTIKNADVIFVMRDGNIIEQGNHDSLLSQQGFYAELYNSQFDK